MVVLLENIKILPKVAVAGLKGNATSRMNCIHEKE